MKNILQQWVTELGLRHQGTLLTAVRGCDTIPKRHHSKTLTCFYRGSILNTHCADEVKPTSFITRPIDDMPLMLEIMQEFAKSHDELPHHYVMHLVHAAEIVGYKHPIHQVRQAWNGFYRIMCRKLHMNPEQLPDLDARLDMQEAEFGRAQ